MLVRAHAAGFAGAARARADDEIGAAGDNRLAETRDLLGAIAAVAVEKGDDVTILCRLDPGSAGAAIAATGGDDASAGTARSRHRVVGAAAVDDNDVVDRACR